MHGVISNLVSCRPHGNYYGVGRTILQTFIPVMSMFINTNYSVTPLTDENIAVREYMRAVRSTSPPKQPSH